MKRQHVYHLLYILCIILISIILLPATQSLAEQADTAILSGPWHEPPRPHHADLPTVQHPTIAMATSASTTLAFSDDFSNPESGWSQDWTDVSYHTYCEGEYCIRVARSGWYQAAWNGTPIHVGDFIMEVDLRLTAPDGGAGSGHGGLFFGETFIMENVSYFAISSDGEYALYNGVRANPQFVIPWTASPAIQTSGAKNRLKVVRQGDQITLYVNEQALTTVPYSNTSFAGLGMLGATWTDSATTLDAIFDNYRVHHIGTTTDNSANLIQNGSFEGDAAPWDTKEHTGFFDLASRSGRASAYANGNGELSQTIAFPNDITASTINFHARFYSAAGGLADPNAQMWLGVQTRENWCYYGMFTPAHNTDWNQFSVTFDRNGVETCRGQTATVYFGFHYPSAATDAIFLLDDVALTISGGLSEGGDSSGGDGNGGGDSGGGDSGDGINDGNNNDTDPSTVLDVSISLHRPSVSLQERRQYEGIIKYFADAVFEASNGGHKIGRVHIYTNWGNYQQADIRWFYDTMVGEYGQQSPCWPNSYVNGIGNAALTTTMCDIFNGTNFLANDRGWRQGGYTIAHEWGHYYYGLFDEYQGSDPSFNSYPNSPHTSDVPVFDSIMSSQWNAVDGAFAWLNFSTAANNQGENAQFRMYGSSAWDTIVRPPDQDPPTSQIYGLPQRRYYPELSIVAPSYGARPRIDLQADHTARSNLIICWDGSCSTPATNATVEQSTAPSTIRSLQIVIDRSAPMTQSNRLTHALEAAQWYVDQATIGRDAIGVLALDDTVQDVSPMTLVYSEQVRQDIKDSIAAIQPGAEGAIIGDALQQALDNYSNGPYATASVGAVLLLSGTPPLRGASPYNVIEAYTNAGVSLYAIDYGGTEASAMLLDELAQSTGGAYHYINPKNTDLANGDATPATLREVFQNVGYATSPVAEVHLLRGAGSINPFGSPTDKLIVDSTLTALEVTASSPISGHVTFTLLDPQGNSVAAPTCVPQEHAQLCTFRVISPTLVAGTWTLEMSNNDPYTPAFVSYRATGIAEGQITFDASIAAQAGQVIKYPEPMVIIATIGKELPITGTVVYGTITMGGSETLPITLRDDGIAPDALAHDGQYAASIQYTQPGEYELAVEFRDEQDNAHYTYNGLTLAPHKDGGNPPTPGPVGQSFTRIAEGNVRVVSYRTDDHADTALGATNLVSNNTRRTGRIDMAGDNDMFRFTVSATNTITLTMRVLPLSDDMVPRLRLLAADSSTELAAVDYIDQDGTVLLQHKAQAGDTFYLHVSHRDPSATSGAYAIGVGDARALQQIGIVRSQVYLPLVMR